MTFEHRIEHAVRPALTITPTMRLAFEILRLSRADLETLIEDQRNENPAIETEADDAEAASDWAEYLGTHDTDVRGTRSDRKDRSAAHDRWLQNLPMPSTSLINHLMEQLRFSAFTVAEQGVAALIINNIDDDGYFRLALEDVAFECGRDGDLVAWVLRQVQDFDPPGVGARDLRECLLLQLQARGEADGLAARIVGNHLELLASRSYDKLAQAVAAPVDDVVGAATHIGTLEPKPGRNFGESETQYIVPDLFVDKIGGEWIITLNDAGLPRLRVSDAYRRLLTAPGKGEAKTYITERLDAAKWLVKCVQRRNRTLQHVMRSILAFQHEFFERGIAHLKPLVQQAVATDIGVHESTVSRATGEKYVHTPQGTFPLTFFFPSGVTGANGDAVSSTHVQERMRALIGGEDSRQPLSDQQIVTLLAQEQIDVKRRTVAKYRGVLGMPTAQERRRRAPRLVAARIQFRQAG